MAPGEKALALLGALREKLALVLGVVVAVGRVALAVHMAVLARVLRAANPLFLDDLLEVTPQLLDHADVLIAA